MWNERFLFVFSVLFAVGLWIAFLLKHNARGNQKIRKFANHLSYAILVAAAVILSWHVIYYFCEVGPYGTRTCSLSLPSVGSILAVLLGGIVGAFSAKFVWSYFGARFGTKDPILGAMVLMILIVVYSLPIYQREIAGVLGHLGLASLKTPFVELSFSENQQVRGATFSASKPASADEHPSAIPRPSYPRPGLERLQQVVSDGEWGELAKDDRYIAFFSGKPPNKLQDLHLQNQALIETKKFLKPAKALAGCLLGYVDIFPDSQLLLIDIKPIIHWFFSLHRDSLKQLSEKNIYAENAQSEAERFRRAILDVRRIILGALNLQEPVENDGDLRNQMQTFRTLMKPREGNQREEEVEEFVTTCGRNSPALNATEEVGKLTYLQPYITIVLANLLVAHGSPDEAVDVLAQWLDVWRCARRKVPDDRVNSTPCTFGPLADAADLPEWFGIRAEFELSVLLYRMAGIQNITYRDFLNEHSKHFSDFVERPASYAARPATMGSYEPITIEGELDRCQTRKDRAAGDNAFPKDESKEPNYRAALLRSLLQNEETLLRSEISFLAGTTAANWADLEGLHERARKLMSFRVQCIYPEGRPDQKLWAAQVASYKITYGLVALAVAQRLMVDAGSSDERFRAESFQRKGAEQLRDGYRDLKPFRDEDRNNFRAAFWSKRVFSLSPWDESCAMAERAVDQLNKAGQ